MAETSDSLIKKICKPLLQLLPDEVFLQLLYFYNFKRILYLNHPQTFNEKIQYFKLHQTQQIFSDLSDKFKVREYVKKTIPEDDILIPLLWYGERFEDIPFDMFPDSFIIKCNHGSGYNIVVYDKTKLDKLDAQKHIKRWMGESYGEFQREKQYKGIQKKLILIEELLPGEFGPLPLDYKAYCFGGKLEAIWLTVGRGEDLSIKFYNKNWGPLDYTIEFPLHKGDVPKPPNFDTLVSYAQRLSQGFPFVRVDLYNINGKIYFGEMTFTPYGGAAKFLPDHDEIDKKLGDLIIL